MESGTKIEYEQVFKHPEYKYDRLQNDICLIKEQIQHHFFIFSQFQKLSKIFKIGLPESWTKVLISPESVLIFWIEKSLTEKKLYRFLIPEFNLFIDHKIIVFKIGSRSEFGLIIVST